MTSKEGVQASALAVVKAQALLPKQDFATTVLFGERFRSKALVGKVFFQSVLGGSLLIVPLVDCQQL
uniref:Uncharacterized protein n=1 Tax=Utricularia reniformis TaxID=192314 RepID=A0A1Y0B0S2_9LAMI|nr:hypothetical protein AEK19_MT0757 [Utricularia reniformis]ART31000.1 hypothetical protein AEK19_MT0757 [Utricularia reniformis]